nr:putative peptidoglycan-binding domain-containing protein [uncultured Lichenicoccus sp.]
MQASFETILAWTMKAEGGLSKDPDDAGNWSSGVCGQGTLIGTNCGISAPVLIAFLAPVAITAEDMAAIAAPTVRSIYQVLYWLPISGASLPAGVDLMVADMAFNAGAAASARILQHVLGVKQDGWIGPATLAALGISKPAALLEQADANAVHGLQQALGIKTDGVIGPQTQKAIAAHPAQIALLVITALNARQSAYYRSLPDYREFGAGWLNRVNARQMAAYGLAIPVA